MRKGLDILSKWVGEAEGQLHPSLDSSLLGLSPLSSTVRGFQCCRYREDALAACASRAGRKVSFSMHRGVNILSKQVARPSASFASL